MMLNPPTRRLRVGYIVDDPGYQGGAELTAAQFWVEAPEWVEVVHLDPIATHEEGWSADEWCRRVDVFVAHNCVQLHSDVLDAFRRRPVVKYVHDVWPHGDATVRRWMIDHARLVFTSPLHVRRFPYPLAAKPVVIPPAMPLDRFRHAALSGDLPPGRLDRALCLTHHSKGVEEAMRWAETAGMRLDVREGVPYEDVPKLMAAYTTFVHRPPVVEPFGRTVAEAWAAGCRVVANENVGAAWWISKCPHLLEDGLASTMFWHEVRQAYDQRTHIIEMV